MLRSLRFRQGQKKGQKRQDQEEPSEKLSTGHAQACLFWHGDCYLEALSFLRSRSFLETAQDAPVHPPTQRISTIALTR